MTPDQDVHAPKPSASRAAGLVAAHDEGCRECWTCARLCPAKAIRIVDGRAEVIEARCVSCGLCVLECASGCFRVRDDTGHVRALLDGPRPVVAVLATEFITALHPLTPVEVEVGLESLGFYAVETTLLGEEIVARAYEEVCARPNGLPLIRSTCPVAVDWVRKYRPSLAQALVPVVPPYIAQARLVKSVYPAGVAVVYVSPCFARKDEAYDAQFSGAVDAAIDFMELSGLLEEAGFAAGARSYGTNRPAPLKELSLTDGFPRAPLEERTMTASDVNVSRGLLDMDRVFDAIEAGEAAPHIVDALNCEGCIDGPAVRPGLSVFAKRNIEIAEREARNADGVGSRELLRYLPPVDLLRSFSSAPVRDSEPTEEEIEAALAEGGITSSEDALDCRACGYGSCADFATAVCRGAASWEMCFPLQRRKLRKNIEYLETNAARDSVTGLATRTALSDRLTDETARYQRYGSDVSVLMLDLDSFKLINDEWGHLVGDQILAAVGHLLDGNIRASDFAARFGGDEFAVILPGTGKTEAYAVAEKIRGSIASTRVSPRESENGEVIGTTASIGVAAVGPDTSDPVSLLAAADRALYAAKEGGRNQVRLAPH